MTDAVLETQVSEEIVNVLELSKLLKVDRSVVVKRIQESQNADDPFPLIQSGTKGRDYEIPAVRARAWWTRQDEKAREAEQARRARLLEAVPPLPGMEPSALAGDSFDDLIKAERLKRERRDNAVADKLLVTAGAADEAIVFVARKAKDAFDELITELERKANLEFEDLQTVIELIHDSQDALADEISRLKPLSRDGASTEPS